MHSRNFEIPRPIIEMALHVKCEPCPGRIISWTSRCVLVLLATVYLLAEESDAQFLRTRASSLLHDRFPTEAAGTLELKGARPPPPPFSFYPQPHRNSVADSAIMDDSSETIGAVAAIPADLIFTDWLANDKNPRDQLFQFHPNVPGASVRRMTKKKRDDKPDSGSSSRENDPKRGGGGNRKFQTQGWRRR